MQKDNADYDVARILHFSKMIELVFLVGINNDTALPDQAKVILKLKAVTVIVVKSQNTFHDTPFYFSLSLRFEL